MVDYTPISFSFGQTLPASDLQTMADNDESFNSGKGILPFTGGWRLLDESWSYSSVSGLVGVITIPSGGTDRFQVGDSIKFTQTTVKYFKVVAVTSTTISVTGGTDYTLVNAAISLISHSKWHRPAGMPSMFSWTPTYTGSGSYTYGTVTTNVARFTVDGSGFIFRHDSTGTGSGTGAAIYVTYPLTARDLYSAAGSAIGFYPGAEAAMIYTDTTARMAIQRYASANYATGAGVRVVTNGRVELAG